MGLRILLNKVSGKASDKVTFEQGLKEVSHGTVPGKTALYPRKQFKVKLGIWRNNEVTVQRMLGMSSCRNPKVCSQWNTEESHSVFSPALFLKPQARHDALEERDYYPEA